MEELQWLREPIGAVISALGGWIVVDALATHLSTVLTVGSIFRAVWNWIRGKRSDSEKLQQTTQSLSGGIGNIDSPLTDNQQVAGHDNIVAGKNSEVHIGDNITHDSRTIVKNTTVNKPTIIKRIFQGDRRRQASQQSPTSPNRQVAAPDELQPDTRIPTAVVPVPTSGEAQSQVDIESVSAKPAPATDGNGNSSTEMTTTNTEASTETEPIGQETSSIEDQANTDKPLGPINDGGANTAIRASTNDSAGGDFANTGPTLPLDKGSLSIADVVNGVDHTPATETRDILDGASDQGRIVETIESAIDQAFLAHQPTIENPEPDNPLDESDTISKAAASIADAIPVAQLSVLNDEPESRLSGEQESLVEVSATLSAQPAEAKAHNIDQDIVAIAIERSAAEIGATLQRLRRARGLSRTDLSYDQGWIMAFEAGCWHTYATDRRCFVRAIHTYLQALGMTTVELRACLPQQDTDE